VNEPTGHEGKTVAARPSEEDRATAHDDTAREFYLKVPIHRATLRWPDGKDAEAMRKFENRVAQLKEDILTGRFPGWAFSDDNLKNATVVKGGHNKDVEF
jgi:hypothetical protein